VALGQALRETRERAGLSIEDVGAGTRVRNAVIAGIESEDFRLCGGDVYARGHIRSIARFLGVSPEPLVQDFDLNFAEEPITASRAFEAERIEVRERRGMNWSFVMAVVMVGVITAAVLSIVNRGDEGDIAEPLPSPTATVAVPTDDETQDATTPTPQGTGVEADASGVVLQMSFTGASWIRVSNGDRVVFEGTERAGSSRTFRDAESLSVVLGNAGAVRLVVNGEDLGIAGGPGQVVRATYTPR
jgi:cytoskeleton protein RodZ